MLYRASPSLLLVACAYLVKGLYASPTILQERSVTPLSAAERSIIAPYAQFAAAAYCSTSSLKKWSCGPPCQAHKDFQVTLVGGDILNVVQGYYVGYSPSLKSVIVAHQGTDPLKFFSILTDLIIILENLDSKLFPGVHSSVKVHTGFAHQHSLTATTILKEVKRLLSAKKSKSVKIVGHSLGGALAELEALFLRLHLPAKVSITAITYGTPRVGNPAFAKLIDTKVPHFYRINNKHDPTPIVPGKFLGFQHPDGEIHILSGGKVVACSGDDNSEDSQCTDESVPTIFSANVLDHLGPYDGVNIGGTLGICHL